MREELWLELAKMMEENNLCEKHKELYETAKLVNESMELGKRQQEIREKLQKINNPKKK